MNVTRRHAASPAVRRSIGKFLVPGWGIQSDAAGDAQTTNTGSKVKFTTVPMASVDATSAPKVAVGTKSLVDITPKPTMSAAVASKIGTPVLPAACRDDVCAVCSRRRVR